MRSSSSLRFGLLSSALCLSLAASGCAASSEDEDTGTATQDLKHHRHIEHPAGVYFADVTANGTGCPAGTWNVLISPDGETFTLLFDRYEAMVAPGQVRDTKDCQLEINLGSTAGLSYSIASFYYQGYVLLDKQGMKARQTASYAFRGNPQRNADRNEVTGPVDESYIFSDEVGHGGQWSSCRKDETLKVLTRLDLRNGPHKTGSGYMNTATVDGSLAFKWKMKWKRCNGPGQH